MAETNDERENAILQLYLNMSQVIQEEPPEITPKEEVIFFQIEFVSLSWVFLTHCCINNELE